eukprot:6206163-Pleurochrysis_carterae.AAC.2
MYRTVLSVAIYAESPQERKNKQKYSIGNEIFKRSWGSSNGAKLRDRRKSMERRRIREEAGTGTAAGRDAISGIKAHSLTKGLEGRKSYGQLRRKRMRQRRREEDMRGESGDERRVIRA